MRKNTEFDDFLITKLQILESKVDALNQDRVTRSDFEGLRKEISGSYVPRDTYEARHSVLIDRDAQLELAHKADIKEMRDYVDRALLHFEQQHEAQLSLKDRFWMRFSQVASILAIVVSVLAALLQHVKFQ